MPSGLAKIALTLTKVERFPREVCGGRENIPKDIDDVEGWQDRGGVRTRGDLMLSLIASFGRSLLP